MGLRLGWSWHRPNDFNGPDLRPLRDSFQSLQKSLTFPYAGVEISGTFNSTYSDKTLTAINAPSGFNEWNLVRNNTIQVPREFEHWMVVANSNIFLDAAAIAGDRYIMGWRLNGVTLTDTIGEVVGLSTTDVRIECSFIRPVKRGDFLSIGVGASNATVRNILDGEAWCIFMPLS